MLKLSSNYLLPLVPLAWHDWVLGAGWRRRAHVCRFALAGGCLACALAVLLYSPPGIASYSIGASPVTVAGSAAVNCRLATTGLNFDFTGLVRGNPATKDGSVAVDCHGASLFVGVTVVWLDQGYMNAGVYTFSDSNDTVLSEFCYRGEASCWVTPTYFDSRYFPIVLRLTYTAAGTEHRRRMGELRVSYY